MEGINIYLSSNLKLLRITNKKTLEDVGKAINKAVSTISCWESGIREPSVIDIANLCNYYHITPDDLILKDLRFNEEVKLDEHYMLDAIATEQAKTLSVEDKKWIIQTMEMINKTKDNKDNKD